MRCRTLMRRSLLAALIVLPVSCGTSPTGPVAETATLSVGPTAVSATTIRTPALTICTVTDSAGRLRTRPETSAPRLVTLQPGEHVSAHERTLGADWVAVQRQDGLEGWAAAAHLDCSMPVAKLPIQAPGASAPGSTTPVQAPASTAKPSLLKRHDLPPEG